MRESQVAQALWSAKYRGKLYATLYYMPKQDLEFIESYDDFLEAHAASKFWKTLGYRKAHVWPLDYWE